MRAAAVVGCGVGGMAAALALARAGWAVTLLEAFAEPRPLGSGLLLQPTGLAALRSLGLDEQVRATGAPVRRLFGRDDLGRTVLDVRYDHWRQGAEGLGVRRAALFGLLHEALLPAGVRVLTGTTVARVVGGARPGLVDASGAEHGPYDLLVVSDGAGSRLRGQLRPRARAPVQAWGAVWANGVDPDGRFDGVLGQVYEASHTMLGVLPTGPDAAGRRTAALFWSVPSAGLDDFLAGDLDRWKARVTALWPEAACMVAPLAREDLARAIYRDVQVGRWSEGAAVLIGDAAHGTSPQLGQGANMALMDAVELPGWLERPSVHPVAVPPALRRYQALRRRHVGLYQLASRTITPLFQAHGRTWPLLRSVLFTPLSRLPGLRRIGAAMLVGALRLGRAPRHGGGE